ncbi:hypothetical protein HU200_039182 [Digitaria exilis]|uniref:Uncharacterized protein n=1 Tax=Digitaria exilis TaxID=1010633 RepID=A0A835BI89_9POAL|nr:hypothetical protein HU200_039182 [Digitaria exilis]
MKYSAGSSWTPEFQEASTMAPSMVSRPAEASVADVVSNTRPPTLSRTRPRVEVVVGVYMAGRSRSRKAYDSGSIGGWIRRVARGRHGRFVGCILLAYPVVGRLAYITAGQAGRLVACRLGTEKKGGAPGQVSDGWNRAEDLVVSRETSPPHPGGFLLTRDDVGERVGVSGDRGGGLRGRTGGGALGRATDFGGAKIVLPHRVRCVVTRNLTGFGA